jgi:glycosyltransferase involved in cell wall biosynthesis
MSTENTPKISVIIATYNYSSVLRYAIATVLWQTFRDFELIVVGDACTDDSETVVRSFGDPRLRWLNLAENSGSKSIPQNAGIKMARGEYIAYLAHDDLWHPCHLETVLNAIEKSGADLVYSVALYVPPPGETPRPVSGIFPEGEFRPGHVLVHSSVLHRKKLIDDVGGWPDPRVERVPGDQLFWTRVIESGKRFQSVPKVTVWKFNASSRPDSYKLQRCDEQARYFELIRDDPALAERELIDVLEAAMRHGLDGACTSCTKIAILCS